MSGVHRPSQLYVEVDSPVHRLAPEPKIVALVAFMIAVVATPREQVGAFAAHAALVAIAAAVAHVHPAIVVRRWLVAAPFLLVALLIPFAARGEAVVTLGPLGASAEGLWASWNVVAKALLGVSAVTVVTASTRFTELLAGFERLRVPPVFTTTAAFMLRYLDTVVDELGRMRVARLSRADDPRWLWQARGVASTAGALFVRTFERGERVHQCMLSRGFTGAMPGLGAGRATIAEWFAASWIPVLAVAVAVVAAVTA
ncbi:MAG: cobalt ECF transporter T component CbiQ [Actinomycetota bacterium]|nr:cobalt ECF transporter T component CbiQ [Actinomycetota bacterium]